MVLDDLLETGNPADSPKSLYHAMWYSSYLRGPDGVLCKPVQIS